MIRKVSVPGKSLTGPVSLPASKSAAHRAILCASLAKGMSSDIIGDTHGGVFDPTQTDVNTVDGLTMARTVSWYDNEYGFTCNMVRTLLYFAEISE